MVVPGRIDLLLALVDHIALVAQVIGSMRRIVGHGGLRWVQAGSWVSARRGRPALRTRSAIFKVQPIWRDRFGLR